MRHVIYKTLRGGLAYAVATEGGGMVRIDAPAALRLLEHGARLVTVW